MNQVGSKWLPAFAAMGLVLACLSVSCGYRFAGGGTLPQGIRGVEVPVFQNRTGETGAEIIFTRAFTHELSRHSAIRLAPENSGGAILLGEITHIRISTASRHDTQTVLERRIFVTVSARLQRADGSVAWAGSHLTGNEVYSVNDNKLITEDNREKALGKIAEKIAEQILFNATSDF